MGQRVGRVLRLLIFAGASLIVAWGHSHAEASQGRYILSPKGKNQTRFVCPAGADTLTGTVKVTDVELYIDRGNLNVSTGKLTADLRTLSTGDEARDSIIKTACLCVDSMRYAVFELDSLRGRNAIGRGESINSTVFGKLKMQGASYPFSAPALLERSEDRMDFSIHIYAEFSLDAALFFSQPCLRSLLSEPPKTIDFDADLTVTLGPL